MPLMPLYAARRIRCLGGSGPTARFVKVRNMTSNKTRKIGRDAGTGQFIPVKEAERRRRTAVVETLPVVKKLKPTKAK